MNKLTAALNESAEKHYSIVSETYDLLQALNHPEFTNQTCQVYKDRYMLFRGSSYAPLREARIRSFKPILKNSYQADKTVNATITIKPYVFDYDADYRYAISKTFNAYDLYNSFVSSQNIEDAQLRVNANQYTVNFTANIEQFVEDIDNCLNQYFHKLDTNGTLNFTDGVHNNYIRNYGQYPQIKNLSITPSTSTISDYTVSYIRAVRDGVFVYGLTPISGTGSAFVVSSPEALNTSLITIHPWKDNIDTGLVDAVASFKDCETVYFCDATHLFSIRNGIFSVIHTLEAGQGTFTFLASNDRSVIVVITNSAVQSFYLLNGYTLTPLTPTDLSGDIRANFNITSIRGYNDQFICYVNSESESRLELCDKYMQQQYVIEESKASGSIGDPSVIDVINKIDAVYVAILFHVAGNRAQIEMYEYSADDGVYRWTKNGSDSVAYTVHSLSHHGGYFMVSLYRSITEEDIYIYPPNGPAGATLYASVIAAAKAVYISGGYERCSLVLNDTATSTCTYWQSELKPINDDVLTINDYKDIFNYPLDEIAFLKFKTITDPLDPDYSGNDNEPTIYSYSLNVPLTGKLLTFNASITTSPIALLYTSEYHAIFNDLAIIGRSYINPRNIYITYSQTYEDDIKRLEFINDDYGLTLYSDHMNNISQAIYTGYTEANVVYKRFDLLPSTNYLTVYLKDAENTVPTKNKLNEFYSRIIVEIDYVYESV